MDLIDQVIQSLHAGQEVRLVLVVHLVLMGQIHLFHLAVLVIHPVLLDLSLLAGQVHLLVQMVQMVRSTQEVQPLHVRHCFQMGHLVQ